jgi:hypothetical protein
MLRRTIRIVPQLIACITVGAVASNAQDGLDGFWESDGFGYVFAIAGPNLKAFEVTATTCVASFMALKVRGSQGADAAAFRSDEGVYRVRSSKGG